MQIMRRTALAFAVALALGFAAVPASACERACLAAGPDGKQVKYSHGFKHSNGQRCKCIAKYGAGEPRTGAPAYYECDWK